MQGNPHLVSEPLGVEETESSPATSADAQSPKSPWREFKNPQVNQKLPDSGRSPDSS